MKLIPKNWSAFQHYRDRCPPWIKLHRDLLNDRAFIMLPTASKALAPMLWLLASESRDGSFDASTAELEFRLRMPLDEIEEGINALILSGFFLDASTMLAPCLQDAIPERETEGETETEKRTLPSRSGRGGAYAFLGKVIKLNAKDLERWRKTYHSIADLEAELSSIDVWWTSQPREKQDKWFHATTNMLNKRHQERSAAIKEGQVRPVMLGP